MQLEPCGSCHRHVAVQELVCPFCGATRTVTRAPSLLDGRWTGRASRAAVFGALLAGCHPTSTTTTPPPPPPDDTQRFAQPPDDAVHEPPPPPPADVAPAAIYGRVVEAGTNRPVAGVLVRVIHEADGAEPAATRTDARGEYRIERLAAGTYTLQFQPPWPMHSHPRKAPEPWPARRVVVGDAAVQRVDMTVHRPAPPPPDDDRGPCCKPYGAPPARRRVV